MPALHQAHANNILDASLGVSAFTATAVGISCRLITTTTASTATTNGSELSGGSYSAGGIPVTFGAASGGTSANTTAITQTGMPVATIGGVELWDRGGTPARKWWGVLSANKTTASGDTFTIAIGSLTASLS